MTPASVGLDLLWTALLGALAALQVRGQRLSPGMVWSVLGLLVCAAAASEVFQRGTFLLGAAAPDPSLLWTLGRWTLTSLVCTAVLRAWPPGPLVGRGRYLLGFMALAVGLMAGLMWVPAGSELAVRLSYGSLGGAAFGALFAARLGVEARLG